MAVFCWVGVYTLHVLLGDPSTSAESSVPGPAANPGSSAPPAMAPPTSEPTTTAQTETSVPLQGLLFINALSYKHVCYMAVIKVGCTELVSLVSLNLVGLGISLIMEKYEMELD